ncbi:hypothetical protein HYX05_05005 [Candidatus Woesearchaeota archaeon]|nr:hypothetical protein [Candidatus Woesearchaeota archaeon]
MPTRVLYIDSDKTLRDEVYSYYSQRAYARVDVAENQHDALDKILKNDYRLLVANYFGEYCFGFLTLFICRDGGLRAAVLSDNKKVRVKARRNGIPNAPKTPVIKNLDLIIKAHRSGKLKEFGLK